MEQYEVMNTDKTQLSPTCFMCQGRAIPVFFTNLLIYF